MTAPIDSSSIRLGGLASGFDTEAIVQSLLAFDQIKIDRLEEEKQLNIAKIQTWEDIGEQLRSLSETVNTLKADGTSTNNLFDEKIVNSSDATVLSATASSKAVPASYSITVNNIAREQVVYGEQQLSTFTVSAGSFELNGTTITTAGGEDLEGVALLINAANYTPGEEVVASVIDDRLVIQTTDTGADSTIYGATSGGGTPFTPLTDDPDGILETELQLIDASGDFTNEAQTSADASLTINGIPVTSGTNVIDDAVNNLTITVINSGSSTLSVSNDIEKVSGVISDFVDLYNETRDFIKRVREAKLDDEDLFGIFASDPLLRQMFGEIREYTTNGVQMTSGDWEGTLTADAAVAGASTVTINGFDPAATSLTEGDYFFVSGDTTRYRLTASATIVANSATVSIYPPLEADITAGASVAPVTQTLEDFGVGVRTDVVSGVDGILGIIDPAALQNALATDMEGVKQIFTRFGDDTGHTGVARRLYDWIDNQIKISVFAEKTRSIEDITIPGLTGKNEDIDEQIERLQDLLDRKEETLIRQFAEMESVISRTQAMGGAISQIGA